MYRKVLQKTIAETNITQAELEKKAKELNVTISRGRINKILNGKCQAPSEKVSRAIAKVCNVDERELVLEGYLEKAPHELIDFFNKLQELMLSLSISQLDNKIDKKSKKILLEEYQKETLSNLIIDILDTDNNIKLKNDMFQISDLKKGIQISMEKPYIIMEDNSMESKIPKNSKLKLIAQQTYKNGDILYVEHDNKKYVRMAFFYGREIFLFPLNSEYKCLYLKNGDYKIIAKIKSIEIDI